MKIDVRYIDDKFRAMRSNENYKNVSKIIDYVVVQKYDINKRTSSNTPEGCDVKIYFSIGNRSPYENFSDTIQESYINEAVKYLNDLKPVKQGEKIWIDLVSRFLNTNGEDLCEKEPHGGIWVDANNYETELDGFINELNSLTAKPVSVGNIKSIKRKVN